MLFLWQCENRFFGPVRAHRGTCKMGRVVSQHLAVVVVVNRSGVTTLSYHCFFPSTETEALRQSRLRSRRLGALLRSLSDVAPPPCSASRVAYTYELPQDRRSGFDGDCTLREQDVLKRRKNVLRVGSLNCRTAADDFLLHSLCGDSELHALDALCLQETRAKEFQELPSGWKCISLPSNSQGGAGVAVLLSPRLARQAQPSVEVIPHRCVAVRG